MGPAPVSGRRNRDNVFEYELDFTKSFCSGYFQFYFYTFRERVKMGPALVSGCRNRENIVEYEIDFTKSFCSGYLQFYFYTFRERVKKGPALAGYYIPGGVY